MPSFLAIASFLRPQSLELGSTFIYGVRISFESFSRVKGTLPTIEELENELSEEKDKEGRKIP
jgi:hypothetical protein